MFQQRLNSLTDKYIDIEYKDFFRYIPYELSREQFDIELHDHDLDSWISIYCKIYEKDEGEYRNNLWMIYCGHKIKL